MTARTVGIPTRLAFVPARLDFESEAFAVDLTPYIATWQVPSNPANRRTFHIAGKPYQFVQTTKGLRMQPGESPWT